MDILTFAMTLAKVKKIPDTAISDAIAAADRAESAADLAQEYGYRIRIDGNRMYIGEDEEEGD